MKIWILTRSENDYNQHGDYFVATWARKPSAFQVAKALGLNLEMPFQKAIALNLVNNGGGRLDVEETWYHLFEIREGIAKKYNDAY
jgi:hypothetical protein